MLRIDLGALSAGPIGLAQVVPADDPLFEPLEVELCQPVRLSGRLADAGEHRYYWRGGLRTRVKTGCRRCLAELEVEIDQPIEVLFTEEENAEDPAVYVIPSRATELDLSEAVREELMLAVPDYSLCREECRGICPRCGADLNTATCSCAPEPDPQWAPLAKLKATTRDQEVE
jgi:uncharacterized protein